MLAQRRGPCAPMVPLTLSHSIGLFDQRQMMNHPKISSFLIEQDENLMSYMVNLQVITWDVAWEAGHRAVRAHGLEGTALHAGMPGSLCWEPYTNISFGLCPVLTGAGSDRDKGPPQDEFCLCCQPLLP